MLDKLELGMKQSTDEFLTMIQPLIKQKWEEMNKSEFAPMLKELKA